MLHNRPRHHPRVILVTAYIIVAVCVGHIYTMGAFFPHIMEMFNTNRAQAAVVQSTALALFSIGGVFYGGLISRMGPQFGCITGALVATVGLVISFFATSLVYLTITGVLYAIGLALQFLASIVVVGQSFEGHQNSIALSILSTAVGAGAMGYNFFMIFLLDTFGLRGTLLILAAMTLHGIPLAVVWPSRPSKEAPVDDKTVDDASTPANTDVPSKARGENDEEAYTDTSHDISAEHPSKNSRSSFSFNEGDENEFNVNSYGTTENSTTNTPMLVVEAREQDEKATNTNNTKNNVLQRMTFLLRDFNFVLFAIGISVVTPISQLILIVVVDLATDKGFTETDGAIALLDVNLFSIAGRIAPGFVLLIPRITTLAVPILGSLAGCISYVILAFSVSFVSMLVACALSGACFGLIKTCCTVTVVKLVGKEYIPDAMGIVLTISGVISAFAGPLTGYIRDQTGSYTPSLLSAAATMFVFGAGVFGVNQYLRVKQRLKSREMPITVVTKI